MASYMMSIVRTACFSGLAFALLACPEHSVDEVTRHVPPNLEVALSLEHAGQSLGTYLKKSDQSPRGVWTCVLAFRTLLGECGGRWLARAVEEGAAPSRRAGVRLLDSDLGAAMCARPLLRDWFEEEADERERTRIARLLLEVGDLSESVRSCLGDGLRSANWRVASSVIFGLTYSDGLVDVFVDDIVDFVEAQTTAPMFGPSSGLGVGALMLLLRARSLSEGVLERLANLLRNSPYADELILDVIAKQGAKATCVLPEILKLVDAPNSSTRAAVCRTLAAMNVRSKAARDALNRLRADDDEDVRIAAELAAEARHSSGSGHGSELPSGLSAILSREYRGRSLLKILLSSETSLRFLSEAPLGFRAALGEEGPRWLAEAVMTGIPPCEDTRLRLLCTDVAAASHALPFLEQWLGSEEDQERQLALAGLVLETGRVSEQAVSVLRTGLNSDDDSVVSTVCVKISSSQRVASLFVREVLVQIEDRDPTEWPHMASFLQILTTARSDSNEIAVRLSVLLENPRYPQEAVLAAIASQGLTAVSVLWQVTQKADAPDPKIRAAVARSLGEIGVATETVIRTLRKLGSDPVASVRVASEHARRVLERTQHPPR